MKLILLIFMLWLPAALLAQHHEMVYIPETDPEVQQKLSQWQDLKFGLLMHWGPYSQWGIVESWSICAEDEGWCKRSDDDYTAYKKEYEKLPETFNPEDFDAEKWAAAAKKAGMKYVVFTTKHHDGFCMFDSKYTDYKITSENVPFHTNPKSNIALEIFNAFRAEGLWTGAYFSKPDWHSNDYWWSNFATPDRNVNYDPAVYPEKWEAFVSFTHNQILELMTDYGKMDILWLDGGWVQKLSKERVSELYARRIEQSEGGFIKKRYVSQDIRMDELVAKCREKQPGLIVVDRAVEGINQNYLTPENKVPDSVLPYPWESCIIAGGGWSWVPAAKYKSGRDAIHLLIDIVAKGGNLLLNIAPGPDGNWHSGAYDLLGEYADWMNINSEAIYGSTTYPPYKEGYLCFTQGKDNSVYMIYLAPEGFELMPVNIVTSSIDPSEVTKITLLGADDEIKWKKRKGDLFIKLEEETRKSHPSKYAWVFKVEMETE
jgi:alpha-L-fucosidase